MRQQTLEELLKPPFRRTIDGSIYDLYNDMICSISAKFVSNKLVRKFVEQALNEKWERDFGEPLRWKITDSRNEYECPKCKRLLHSEAAMLWYYSYCPHCGQKLDPPENKGNK